jgi:C4-dicarboxylate-specific signal transduction histidine kinase
VCSALNVTQARRMGEVIEQTRSRLDRAQRAAALGQLSAAIAHELNQPLSAIRSSANAAFRWLRRDTPDIAEANAALETVLEAVRQADDVIRGVRTLTGKAEPDLKFLMIDELIEDCCALMQREMADQRVRLSMTLGAPATGIRADRVLLQQVLVNLMINAIQAMDDSDDAAKRISVTSKRDGGSVVITVADRGPGWDAQYLDLAFEAFQTTKSDGMGLGLSISRAAMDAHGGEITLLNHDGGGACVQLRLPIADAIIVPAEPDAVALPSLAQAQR